jgi:hypothetical protein
MIAAAQPPIASTPCSIPPSAATRALASASFAPAASSAYWSSASALPRGRPAEGRTLLTGDGGAAWPGRQLIARFRS